jgi:hypothetical protein
MADTGLHMMAFHIGAQATAELLSGECLSDRANVVTLALDRKERGAPDEPRIDPRPRHSNLPSGNACS